MDHTEAFRILSFELNELASEPFEDLVSLVGVGSQQMVNIGPHQVEFEIKIRWVDEQKSHLELHGWAHGPSCWWTERVEARILLENPF